MIEILVACLVGLSVVRLCLQIYALYLLETKQRAWSAEMATARERGLEELAEIAKDSSTLREMFDDIKKVANKEEND